MHIPVQVLRAARWPLDGGALAQLYLSLLTYILMDQARPQIRCCVGDCYGLPGLTAPGACPQGAIAALPATDVLKH